MIDVLNQKIEVDDLVCYGNNSQRNQSFCIGRVIRLTPCMAVVTILRSSRNYQEGNEFRVSSPTNCIKINDIKEAQKQFGEQEKDRDCMGLL